MAALFLGACGLFSAPFPDQPDAAGPIVVLTDGEHQGQAWRHVAYRSQDGGFCQSIQFGTGGSSGGCGEEPQLDGADVGLATVSDSRWPTFAFGLVGSDVALVVVETRDGFFSVDANPVPAELDVEGGWYLVVLPQASAILGVTSFDQNGEPIGSTDTGLSR